MALSTSTIFEINGGATASNVNGGGFNPANANMLTDLTTDANTGNTNSPVVSSASYSFVAGDAGHWVYIKSGTNWTPGWYQIASVASNKATLSASIGQAVQALNARDYGANTVAGVATVGTPTNGTWTMDYSQATASPFASTDIASLTGTTNPSTVTSVSHPFGPQMVGNVLHITAGTSWTQDWYEIVSVTSVTATLDRAVGSSATLTSGTGKVGGALSLPTDVALELGAGSATASPVFFIKGNTTYTLTGSISISTGIGAGAWHTRYEGYNSIRGDRPVDSTRPLIACAANTFILGSDVDVRNIIFTTTAAAGLNIQTRGNAIECKAINKSTSSDQVAISLAGTSCTARQCEAVSYRGIGIAMTGLSIIDGCYAHDCNKGISLNTTSAINIINTIVESCVTSAIHGTLAQSGGPTSITNCTLYGSENTTGTGVNILTSSIAPINFKNNIVYGFATGVSHPDVNTIVGDDYNDYFNNDSDVNAVTKWQKGPHDSALNPTFTNVAQVTGATATTTAGNHLVQSGATFMTSGVTAGRDCVYIASGTGVTAGIYGIASVDSETQITTDIAVSADATADKVFQITTGRNFAIGTNLKALGYPGALPGALSTGYMDIGAAQRQETSSSAGMIQSRVFTGF